MRWGMVIDVARCVGCQTCTIACKQEHGLPPDTAWRWVADCEVGEYPDVRRLFLPMQCMHCASPPCVPVCPTGASRQRRGRHRLDRRRRLRGLRLLRDGVPLSRPASGAERDGLLRRADARRARAGAAGAPGRHDQVHLLQGARGRRARARPRARRGSRRHAHVRRGVHRRRDRLRRSGRSRRARCRARAGATAPRCCCPSAAPRRACTTWRTDHERTRVARLAWS